MFAGHRTVADNQLAATFDNQPSAKEKVENQLISVDVIRPRTSVGDPHLLFLLIFFQSTKHNVASFRCKYVAP